MTTMASLLEHFGDLATKLGQRCAGLARWCYRTAERLRSDGSAS
ncbi:hypothetical protein RQ831_03900 [Roseomonas gilardii]|uniref:Transposase n=1 Tax=Roseomonas gilardii TaxID=257708 RepID=A0ABU3MBE7_9PROT|nr:hypothetical protein [Roseomonas gilardii]MDT8330184.1 hypothetical protein [Roseomonas gilardii]